MNSVEPASLPSSDRTVTENGTQKDKCGIDNAVTVEQIATAITKQNLGNHGQNRVVFVLKGKDRLDGQKLYVRRAPLTHSC